MKVMHNNTVTDRDIIWISGWLLCKLNTIMSVRIIPPTYGFRCTNAKHATDKMFPEKGYKYRHNHSIIAKLF